jgi:hypothetical protein
MVPQGDPGMGQCKISQDKERYPLTYHSLVLGYPIPGFLILGHLSGFILGRYGTAFFWNLYLQFNCYLPTVYSTVPSHECAVTETALILPSYFFNYPSKTRGIVKLGLQY